MAQIVASRADPAIAYPYIPSSYVAAAFVKVAKSTSIASKSTFSGGVVGANAVEIYQPTEIE